MDPETQCVWETPLPPVAAVVPDRHVAERVSVSSGKRWPSGTTGATLHLGRDRTDLPLTPRISHRHSARPMASVSQSIRVRWTRKHLVLAIALVALAASACLLAWRLGLMAMLNGAVERLRAAGPIVFFTAMAFLPSVGFPLMAFTLVAGPVFGPTLGAGWVITWSLVALTVNLLLTYWLADRAVRPLVTRLLAYFQFRLPENVGGDAWQLALIVRLTPGPPFWLQSYALGMVRVSLVPYLIVSILVTGGYVVALICGGDAIAQGNGRIAVIAAGGLVVCAVVLHTWRKRTMAVNRAASPTNSVPSFRIAIDGKNRTASDAGLPVLAGEAAENLFGAPQPSGRSGAFALFRTGDWLIGAATVPLSEGLEATTRRLYRDLFEATRGWHVARIWNYVPAINESDAQGLENYRVFCRARSLAFEQHYGEEFKAVLPSASAVGTQSAELTVVFAACAPLPRHVENPLQVPAYDYPQEYGPRAPCFARATVVSGNDRATVFISGTAAIRGHATVAPDALDEQLICTIENLREISAACGLGADLDRAGASRRHFKVYLRRPADQPVVAATLSKTLLRSGDRVSYLHADICRAPRLVEIEATLFDAVVQRRG